MFQNNYATSSGGAVGMSSYSGFTKSFVNCRYEFFCFFKRILFDRFFTNKGTYSDLFDSTNFVYTAANIYGMCLLL
jgi:hypothetical protein